MVKLTKNFLPRKVFKRILKALKFSFIIIIFLNLAGYFPTLSIPPVRRSIAFAQTLEQKGEIISSSFSKPLILPHPGYLSTKFSKFHPGIDIAAGLGMLIHPILDGTVEEVGRDFFGLGNFVLISHEKGYKSKYAHLGAIYAKTGDKVSAENTLGEVGITGRTSGPHTHLEITLNGEFIDPQKLLPEIPDTPIMKNP